MSGPISHPPDASSEDVGRGAEGGAGGTGVVRKQISVCLENAIVVIGLGQRWSFTLASPLFRSLCLLKKLESVPSRSINLSINSFFFFKVVNHVSKGTAREPEEG